jgi:hypothetical protein
MEPKDRHLDTPAEANRDKHINFAALENNEEDPADIPPVGALATEQAGNAEKQMTFDFLIDGVDYFVRITPFSFNDDTRYFVSVNDGPNHLFVWDDQMQQIRSLNNEAAVLPDGLETAISHKLISGK